jgi:hypothetical protein
VVRCELVADGDGTRLSFMHKGLGFTWIGLVLPGWHELLERLAGLTPEPAQILTRSRWHELQNAYLDRYRLEGVMTEPPPGHGREPIQPPQ